MPFATELHRPLPLHDGKADGRITDRRSRKPDRLLAIGPLTCTSWLVAGVGFDPTTSGL